MGTARRFKAKNGLDNNNNSIINVGVSGANLTRAGAHDLTLTTTNTTNVTLPTTGTLAILAANLFTGVQTITTTTANQLALRYDTNNAVNFDVSNVGLLTVTPKTGNAIVTGTNSGGWVLGEWTQASGTSGYAMLGHKGLTHSAYGNYAVYQTGAGQTALNASSGQELQLCNNNTVIAKVTGSGLSGKIVPAINSTVTSNTITPDADTNNMLSATGLAAGITIANHSGTPQNGQRLMVRLKDNGTARSISFGTAYAAGGVALPTTTTAGKMTHLGFIYDTGAAKWMLIASVTEA